MGRKRLSRRISDWRSKMRPVFFELAELNQEFEKRFTKIQRECRQGIENAAGANSADTKEQVLAYFRERVTELSRQTDEKLVDIDKRYRPFPSNPLAYNYLTVDPPLTDPRWSDSRLYELQGIFEWLHFQRHGESFLATARKDANGEVDAWDRIARTERDFRTVFSGKGPIKPFRFELEHRQLLELIICFENERLTHEELASYVDCYCGCGMKHHQLSALQKMRLRLEEDLQTGMLEATDS